MENKTFRLVCVIEKEHCLMEVHLPIDKLYNPIRDNTLANFGDCKLVSCVGTTDRVKYFKYLIEARLIEYRDILHRYDRFIENLIEDEAPASVILETKRMQDEFLEVRAKSIGRVTRRYYNACNSLNRDIDDLDELVVQFCDWYDEHLRQHQEEVLAKSA